MEDKQTINSKAKTYIYEKGLKERHIMWNKQRKWNQKPRLGFLGSDMHAHAEACTCGPVACVHIL